MEIRDKTTRDIERFCKLTGISKTKLSREERIEKWEAAHRRTIAWLFDTGVVG